MHTCAEEIPSGGLDPSSVTCSAFSVFVKVSLELCSVITACVLGQSGALMYIYTSVSWDLERWFSRSECLVSNPQYLPLKRSYDCQYMAETGQWLRLWGCQLRSRFRRKTLYQENKIVHDRSGHLTDIPLWSLHAYTTICTHITHTLMHIEHLYTFIHMYTCTYTHAYLKHINIDI